MKQMPKTKFQSFIFTFITAWMMVYFMTLYNMVLSADHFTNTLFLDALLHMWIEFVIIFLCAYFFAGHIAKYFAFRIVRPEDRSIFIILTIQLFTVITQVFFASIMATIKLYGFTFLFLPHFLTAYCTNFIMALPLQLIVVGPAARFIFRNLFLRKEKEAVLKSQTREQGEEIMRRIT